MKRISPAFRWVLLLTFLGIGKSAGSGPCFSGWDPSCQDNPDFRSYMNAPCEEHRKINCEVLSFIGYTEEQVYDVINNCPCSCGIECGIWTISPSSQPSVAPSGPPTTAPSSRPTVSPSAEPSASPSTSPTHTPTVSPSSVPSARPSASPTHSPTSEPSVNPSSHPTGAPSSAPSARPSSVPTHSPSSVPSVSSKPSLEFYPSTVPSDSFRPSFMPTAVPSLIPSDEPSASFRPSFMPTVTPFPTASPTHYPTISQNVTSSPTISSSQVPVSSEGNTIGIVGAIAGVASFAGLAFFVNKGLRRPDAAPDVDNIDSLDVQGTETREGAEASAFAVQIEDNVFAMQIEDNVECASRSPSDASESAISRDESKSANVDEEFFHTRPETRPRRSMQWPPPRPSPLHLDHYAIDQQVGMMTMLQTPQTSAWDACEYASEHTPRSEVSEMSI